MLNFGSIVFLCGILAIQAATPIRPLKSPFFEVEDGILVPIGKESRASNGRIVGGENSDPGSAPWMVSLQWGVVRPAHFCGGTIINPNWVLSAGHCILAYPEIGISTVVAGIHDLIEFSDAEQIRHVTHSNTWVHEDYDGYIGPHDIGLMVFQTPFTFNSLVGALPLPYADEPHSGIATLHGWGSVSYTNYPSYPTILQYANMPIIPLQTCRLSWNYNPDPIHDTHLCAGSLDGGVGPCSLDSGGALAQNGRAVGIFSWGTIPCGLSQRPGIFVRISAYIDWIEDTIDNY